MKKILIIGFVGLLSSINIFSIKSNILNYTISKKNHVKQWYFSPIISTKGARMPWVWLYFAIDNINLSLLGINTIEQLHSYNTIEIPGLKIKYYDFLGQARDIWNPKKRQLKSENWYPMFHEKPLINPNFRINLESAATLWYSDYGDLMMRLAYRTSANIYLGFSQYTGARIIFESGSVIKIY